MERFMLSHTVHRTMRLPTTDVTVHDDRDEARRIADIEAAFTTANPWRQELVDVETGQRWVRTPTFSWRHAERPR